MPARRLAVLLVVPALAAAAGCGSSGPSDPEQIRATLHAFAAAVARHDTRALCRRVLAPELVREVESVGLPCEVAARGFTAAQRPSLTVGRITVRGDRASARVHTSAANQAPSDDTLDLVRTGQGWRVASLGR